MLVSSFLDLNINAQERTQVRIVLSDDKVNDCPSKNRVSSIREDGPIRVGLGHR
jgi:hypothetical protein